MRERWAGGSQASRSLECTTCLPDMARVEPLPATFDSGNPGGSSLERYERLHAKREAAIEDNWGRFAGVVKFLTDDPQSTRAWRSPRKVSGSWRAISRSVSAIAQCSFTIDECQGTRGNIDHLVVASSGVWIIDAKLRKGLIELRDVGGWFKVDRQLYVGGRRRTKVVDHIGWQVEAVRNALDMPHVPVLSAVCFVDGEWRLFAKPFQLKGVLVCWPKKLAEKASLRNVNQRN
jgi:hypothetical protein